uniref:Zinc finger protein rotund n=1 Tax=Macrostomum lignano TaxID=282301 RepID=A0A1I8HDP2_9PLAT
MPGGNKRSSKPPFGKPEPGRSATSAAAAGGGDSRPYQCDTCGRQFATSAYLSQHRRIHSGQRPYGCRFCDKRFTQLSHVQQHERIHTGDKPYRCWHCAKSFTQMSNLQSHQRQHMKDKPHRCEACYMCFDSSDDLDSHTQAKHANSRYSKLLVCRVCGKNYNSETYLNKHLAKHGKDAAAAAAAAAAGFPGAGSCFTAGGPAAFKFPF